MHVNLGDTSGPAITRGNERRQTHAHTEIDRNKREIERERLMKD
jgi:hypothetical protein